jgi:hypothetical protein
MFPTFHVNCSNVVPCGLRGTKWRCAYAFALAPPVALPQDHITTASAGVWLHPGYDSSLSFSYLGHDSRIGHSLCRGTYGDVRCRSLTQEAIHEVLVEACGKGNRKAVAALLSAGASTNSSTVRETWAMWHWDFTTDDD